MAVNRDYRSRSRSRRGDTEADAIAVALTVQILLCVILLVAAGVVRGVNEEKYNDFKQEWVNLTGSNAEGEDLAAYFQELGTISQHFFSSVENLLGRVFGRGEVAPEVPSEVSPAEESAFEYHYLEPQSVAVRPMAFQASVGSAASQMEAPAGNTLAPVYLAGIMRPPVSGIVTSPFAYRVHPVNGGVDFHNGIDIAAPEGRGILAALPGEVVEVGFSSVYGNYIIVQHATNLKTFYAHCSQIIAREGMAVNQGERIALVGQTGLVTGSHLHFSVIVEEQFADPYWVLGDYLELVE